MLFEMTLMNFDAYELIDASPFLGPFCFSLFILLVVFICLSMFISIINNSFRFVRDNAHVDHTEDYEVIIFIFRKFQRWMGFGGQKELILTEGLDERMQNIYDKPMDHFQKKIDQLLCALNRLYMSQQGYVPK